MKRSQLFTGLLALAMAAAGCDRAETRQQAQDAAAEVRTVAARAGDRVADGWLTAKVQAQFFADEDIKSRFIDVTARDGVVTLTGFVESDQVRQEAVEIARHTDGVSQVDDQLLIGQRPQETAQREPDDAAVPTSGTDLPAPTGSYAEAMDDHMVASLIQARYFREPQIKRRNINVAAADGIVTLRGRVASEDERALALLLARTTAGVERVEDGLTIDVSLADSASSVPESVGTSGVRTEDSALETTLRTRVAGDPQLNSADLEISARDGVVLLQGTVADEATKQRAVTMAREIDGVVQVVDRLNVRR